MNLVVDTSIIVAVIADEPQKASQLDIYAYDAYIIACAINRNCPLLSLDAGLIRAAKTIGVNVLEVKADADLS